MKPYIKEYYNKLVNYNEFNHNPLHNKIIGKFFLDLLYKELNGEKTEFGELEDSYTRLLCKVYQNIPEKTIEERYMFRYIDFFSSILILQSIKEEDLNLIFFSLTLPCSWETGYEFME